MCSDSGWLPQMAQVSPWQHPQTHEMLYGIFQRDFVITKPRYNGFEVWHFRKRKDFEDGKEKLFWHLTSRENKKPIPRHKRKFQTGIEQETVIRLPDLRRAERLPWVRPIIENCSREDILAWDYLEGDGNIKTYVWFDKEDFVVIMKNCRNNTRRLITSFYIDNDYKRDDFKRKYANRIR